MNRNKRRYARATRKSIKHSCLAEYWAWKAKLAHSADIEDSIEITLQDLDDFARRSCATPGTPMDMETFPPLRMMLSRSTTVTVSPREHRSTWTSGSVNEDIGISLNWVRP